jgi:hypothetical protein
MTDGQTNWGTAAGGQPSGPSRGTLVAGAIAGTIVLAMIGSLGGCLIANAQQGDSRQVAEGDPTPTYAATPTATAKTTRPTSTRPTKSTATNPPAGQFVLPNLVGMDFEDARAELRGRKLGWQLVFGGVGTDRTVSGSDPRAGTTLKPGTTVRVFVIGAAPTTAVPVVTGSDCGEAADELVEAGLYPLYPTEKKGSVLKQEPEAGSELRWNGQVRIYCGKAGDKNSPPAR